MSDANGSSPAIRLDAHNFAIANQALVGMAMFVLAPIALLEFYSLCEAISEYCRSKSRSGVPAGGDNRKSSQNNLQLRAFLFGQLISGLLTLIAMSLPVFSEITLGSWCSVIVKLVCVFYCISTQMTYLFFVKKASLVIMYEKGKTFNLLVKLTWWGLMLFIPAFVVPVASVITMGVITKEDRCVLFLTQLWFPVLFVAGNLGLSSALLFLFIVPLRNMAVTLSHTNSASSIKIRRVMRRNAVLACLIAITSTLSVIGTCIVTGLAMSNMDEYGYLLEYSYASTAVDLIICSVSARLMTDLWMPQRVQRMIKPQSHPESNDANPTVHAHATPHNSQVFARASQKVQSPHPSSAEDSRTISTLSSAKQLVGFEQVLASENA